MTYSIAIIKQGIIISTVDGIEATNALEAINRVEAEQLEYPTIDKNGNVIRNWTGFEFQARRLDFVLS